MSPLHASFKIIFSSQLFSGACCRTRKMLFRATCYQIPKYGVAVFATEEGKARVSKNRLGDDGTWRGM
jgi:hypothetical protein